MKKQNKSISCWACYTFKLFFLYWSSFALFLSTTNWSSFLSHFFFKASISTTTILHLSSFDIYFAADFSFSKICALNVEITFSKVVYSELIVFNSIFTWINSFEFWFTWINLLFLLWFLSLIPQMNLVTLSGSFHWFQNLHIRRFNICLLAWNSWETFLQWLPHY